MKIKIFDVIYLLFIFTILIPFLLYKYIFLLDFIPTTNVYPILDILYGKTSTIYGGTLFFSLISMIISTEIFQKILIIIILFCGTYSIYGLMNKLIPSRIAGFYSCLLYMFNPYTYTEIMAGQLFLLFSYAIFPLLLKTFVDLLEKKGTKELIKFIFLLSIVSFNIHILIISFIIMSIIFLFWLNKYKDIKITKMIILSILLFILLNSYWIIPVITAKNTMVDNIWDKDFEVFMPKGGLFDIISMYGFWREGYIYAKDLIPYWQLLSLLIISLAIYGFISFIQDEKIGYIVKALGVIGIIGFVLATGINGPFGSINHWLYDNTILKGFRDSHKFVAMIVFTYAILGGLGINKIKNAYDKIK